MERIRIRISESGPGAQCAMVTCKASASHHIVEVDSEGREATLAQDFCDAHFTVFMLNGLIEVVD